MAESDSGSVCCSLAGSESTDRDRASRVKPWVLTRGKASLRRRELANVLV